MRLFQIGLLALVLISVGCAEGALWKAGKYSPWAQKQWAEEEQIANTLFSRKKLMADAANSVVGAPVEQQQKVAEQLSDVLYRDSVLLLRLHALDLLGNLDCPKSLEAIGNAVRDNNSDIRIAAIKSLQKMSYDKAVPMLQEIIGSDSNIDVRLAATRALGNFPGERTVAALSLAIEDTDPALQLRAAESLQKVTGESLGRDIGAWKQYVGNFLPNAKDYTAPEAEPQNEMSTGFDFGSRKASGSDTNSFNR